jgi:L-asparaginase II
LTNPILVEATRGGIVESWHRGAIAIAGPDGRLALAIGDIEQPVFPRSAIKLIQAMPLLESGAAGAYGYGDAELALAQSSHSAEARHVELAASMLERAGLSPGDLECGAHLPLGESAARALLAARVKPTALHNNCSGKHAGMLATAAFGREPTAGYVRPDHPVQRHVARILEELTGACLAEAPCGVDGCSVPTWALPLSSLAAVFARLASGTGVSQEHSAAALRLMNAAMAEPFMIAGNGRFCTRVMEAAPGRIFAKTGAEGVYCAALSGRGHAIALKIDDGAKRGAEIALGAALQAMLPEAADALDPLACEPVRNVRGIATGELRPSDELRRALAGIAA